MKCVCVLFDSLILNALQSYGGTVMHTPHFNRLAQKSIQFNNHYVGSLPCMPARRDLHTGRLNFMHRAWGPLEPFDNSWVHILRQQGVYCHMITDHNHYFQEGGTGYHNTFNSWQFIRGQEKDAWKAMVKPPMDSFKQQYDPRHYPSDAANPHPAHTQHITEVRLQHMINRESTKHREQDYCTPRCFDQAIQFFDTNRQCDDWVLWLECFDPHEPFDSPDRFREKYGCDMDAKLLNWPLYGKVHESDTEVAEIRKNYMAVLDMCDAYLGKMLDYFDRHNMWQDTALILTTDHGFLLGEHEWWAKNGQPYYQEIAHIPLFVYHPTYAEYGGENRCGLTQTGDIMPTILEMFDAPIPDEVRAKSLMPMLAQDGKIHDSVLFGMFGGPLGVTDGQYVYFHFPNPHDGKHFYDDYLYEYTLMPTHLESYFSAGELQTATCHKGFDFTKGMPVLKVKTYKGAQGCIDPHFVKNNPLGSALYNVQQDPQQQHPIYDQPQTIDTLKKHIVNILQAHDAPAEIYEAYGL